MWRTVIVSKGEKITVKNGWMIVYGDNIESHVPIEDIYSVVIDNRAAYISVQTVTTLARAGSLKCQMISKRLFGRKLSQQK